MGLADVNVHTRGAAAVLLAAAAAAHALCNSGSGPFSFPAVSRSVNKKSVCNHKEADMTCARILALRFGRAA